MNTEVKEYSSTTLRMPIATKPKVVSKIAIVVSDESLLKTDSIKNNIYFSYLKIDEVTDKVLDESDPIDAVFIDISLAEQDLNELKDLLRIFSIPFILYTPKFSDHFKKLAIKLKVDDYLYGDINQDIVSVLKRIKKVKDHRNEQLYQELSTVLQNSHPEIKIWKLKRALDIAISSICLIAASPLLLLITLIIKLESKGPVFYISKRAGAGYKVFNFYKFRSMRQDADKALKDLAHLNQYQEKSATDSVFFKLKDDPRVTKFGSFLRKTSLDEIPQLFNVLKGDMSIVGNRPLPLYEAEKLTRDNMAGRFLAPAGITGLWQITKRGKSDMSPEERIQLDIDYAQKNSFWFDLRIIFMTFPALLQKEKV